MTGHPAPQPQRALARALAALVTLSTALAATLGTAACGERSPCGPAEGTVQRAIDGDTLELEDGRTVRLLLIDTPETTGGAADCYGAEARAATEAAAVGRRVTLDFDASACTDAYGRTLAFVRAGALDLNAHLVEAGYACALFVAPAGEAQRERFLTLEAEARTARRGMWGACATIPCSAR